MAESDSMLPLTAYHFKFISNFKHVVNLPHVMRVLHIQCVKDACTDAPILFATTQDPYEPSFGTSIVSPFLTTQSASSVMQPAVTCASLTVGDCLGLFCTIAICVPLFALEP